MQCLGSLKTEAALQTWTGSRLRALHPGHVGCKQSPAWCDERPEHCGTNNLFSADKDTGPFPPVCILCCLAIPDVGREITESNLLHPYTLLPAQQTKRHGLLLIPLLRVEVRKSKLSSCGIATLSLLLYPTPWFFPSTQTVFSFTTQNPQYQPNPDAVGCTCIIHTHPHSHTSKNKYWTGENKEDQLKATTNMASSDLICYNPHF